MPRNKWFCNGNKIRDNKYLFFLLLQPKISLQQPNVLLIELNILLLSQNIFVIPILTNDFVGITKPFIPCRSSAAKSVQAGVSTTPVETLALVCVLVFNF